MIDDYENEEDPDQLIPISAATFHDVWVKKAQDELAEKRGWDMKDSYPALMLLTIQMEIHAVDYPDIFAIYLNKKQDLDERYGSAMDRLFEIYPEEADLRLNAVMYLSRNLGTMMIDSKFARREQQSTDWIEFSKFED